MRSRVGRPARRARVREERRNRPAKVRDRVRVRVRGRVRGRVRVRV